MISTVKRMFSLLCFIMLFSYCGGIFVANVAANPLGDTVAESYEENSEEEEVADKTTDQPEGNTVPDQLDITFFDGFQMIFALIFVIAILYFLLKFINKRSQTYQQNRIIQNFGGTSLGGNRSIQVVKVGNQLLVLGVGEDIQLLKEITDKEELDDYIRQHNEQLEQSLQPADFISKWVRRGKNLVKTSSESNTEKPSFNHYLKGQLEQIRKERRDAMNKMGKKESKQDE